MKSSGVIGSAASGIASRSFHEHFHDVNPIKKQGVTHEERRLALQAYYIQRDKEKRRLREVISLGGRLLPTINFKIK